VKRLSGPTLIVAALAALLWMGIGTLQRTQGGTTLAAALLAELPLTAAVFIAALVLMLWRRR